MPTSWGHQPWPGGGWRRPRPACGRRASSFLHNHVPYTHTTSRELDDVIDDMNHEHDRQEGPDERRTARKARLKDDPAARRAVGPRASSRGFLVHFIARLTHIHGRLLCTYKCFILRRILYSVLSVPTSYLSAFEACKLHARSMRAHRQIRESRPHSETGSESSRALILGLAPRPDPAAQRQRNSSCYALGTGRGQPRCRRTGLSLRCGQLGQQSCMYDIDVGH